ncbi:MAG: DUF4367 domain-containing protein [Ruminococcaceae bacterium]|nr:DUF4367 domain-containing protein [Oscillospiraceae bacterium]
MVKNDKLDILIMTSGDILVCENLGFFENTDTSGVCRPKSLDRRVRRTIKKEYGKKEYGLFYTIAKRCVAAVLVLCTISFVVSLNDRPAEAIFLNATVHFYDEYLEIEYECDESAPDRIEELREIDPGDETWKKTVASNNEMMYTVFYEKDGTKILSFSQKLTKTSSSHDSTGVSIKEVMVADHPALLLYKKSRKEYSICWCDGEYKYTIASFTPEISKEEIIAIAESVYK